MQRGFDARLGCISGSWAVREVSLTLVLVIKDWNKTNVTLRLKNIPFYLQSIVLTVSIPNANQNKFEILNH